MTLYCECETPAVDLEHGEGCRRCGRPIDWSPRPPSAAAIRASVERDTELEPSEPPAGAWPMHVHSFGPWDYRGVGMYRRRYCECGSFEARPLELERGSVDPRLVIAATGVVTVAVTVWLLWPYLVAAGVLYGAYRHLMRGTRRRRPRSSWSSLGRTGALLFAAWNSRWLKPDDRRVTVPANADGTYCRCGAHVADTPCYVPAAASSSSSPDTVPF